MKSRGIYETPGGTILLEAHRGIEQITLIERLSSAKMNNAKYAELMIILLVLSERRMLQKIN